MNATRGPLELEVDGSYLNPISDRPPYRSAFPRRASALAVILAVSMAMITAACASSERLEPVGSGDVGTVSGTPGDDQQHDDHDHEDAVGGLSGLSPTFLQVARHVHFDYDLLETPAALAQMSDIVVSGQIVAASQGRGLARENVPHRTRQYVTLTVQVFDVHKVDRDGRLLELEDNQLQFELRLPSDVRILDLEESLPTMQVLLFLVALPATEEAAREDGYILPGDTSLDYEAGRPSGAGLYQPVSPQGFLLDVNGAVTQAMQEGEPFPDLDDARTVESIRQLLSVELQPDIPASPAEWADLRERCGETGC